jgi:xylulokinase
MLLLGIDVGTSSVKISVMDANDKRLIVSVRYPEIEANIISKQPGWAEQSPYDWWAFTQSAIAKANSTNLYNPKDIAAIGISYQMHGLVCVDKNKKVLRDSIIWCDSRAVEIGNSAMQRIGEEKCLTHLLNSPGNFTASKLSWVKQHEPEIYKQIYKIMLPGDFISMQFTGEITTSISALSEGIFWDFKNKQLSEDIMRQYGFDNSFIPEIKNVFSSHGLLRTDIAEHLSMTKSIPVTYKSGDQPNNAFSLNVLKPGEVAATAGTSGVIYAVTDKLFKDTQSRVNSFAHVNYTTTSPFIGVLLCINGCGIMNKWVKQITGNQLSYNELNAKADAIPAGSNGLKIFPFGNGSERMLNNKMLGATIEGIDLNKHTAAHIYRAAQEGIAFAFRYGLDIMKENGLSPAVIRAGKSNMFLSEVFTKAFVNATNIAVELYNSDGSAGAALGAGMGAGFFNSEDAFAAIQPLQIIDPTDEELHEEFYQKWRTLLIEKLKT